MSDDVTGCNCCCKKVGSKGFDEVAVVGSGRLSREVASLSSMRGLKVHLFCDGEEAVKEAKDSIKADLDFKVSRWMMSAGEAKAVFSRLYTYSDLENIPESIGLVVDCSGLSGDERAGFCKRLDGLFGPEVVIAPNIGATTLHMAASRTENSDRFAGIRFSPPVWQNKTVELFANGATSPSAITLIKDFVTKLGKEAIILNDVPGNISVNVFLSLFVEAVRIIDEEKLEPKAVNEALKDVLGMKYGPLEMADRIGLDTLLSRCEMITSQTGLSQYAPPQRLKDLVAQGKLGYAHGEGFLTY